MSRRSSRISGFYKLSIEERLKIVSEFADLTSDEIGSLKRHGALDIEIANRMIENVISTYELPLGIAVNFLINGRDYLIPMVIEEPSVVAAASNAARMAREGGGVYTSSTGPYMIGQIQLVKVPQPAIARLEILKRKDEILELANQCDPVLVRLGGGAKDLEARILETRSGVMLIVHLIVDVRDAMGANAVNTMAETIAPRLASIAGGYFRLR
ncbi:MAG: 3-hydroxy-3-methylglutaryl-CoA reductase, partial [Nitrososphaerota archaeon]